MKRRVTSVEHGAAVLGLGFVVVGCEMEPGAVGRADVVTDGARADAQGREAGAVDAGRVDGGDDAAPTCAVQHFTAENTRRPIDVIIWIDGDSSSAPVRAKVGRAINASLGDILNASGADYRVILLATNTTLDPPLGTSPRYFPHPGGYGGGSERNFGGYKWLSSRGTGVSPAG